ncbi:hypothetical protein CS379_26855 [Methylobacterium frigidaeris]|nr:hypothetical protein CS379_26855 [Methylobacterium frigidaeris]
MAKLVQANLPVAYAGARTTAPVIEVAERPRPAVVAERPVATRTLVASADEDDAVETTNSTGQPLDIAPRGGATPQSSPKWRAAAVGAVPASAQAYAPATTAAFPAANGKYASRLPASEPGEARAPAPREAASPAAKPVTVTPWVIQLGAMDDEGKAKSMLTEARQRSGGALGKAAPFTEKVTHGGTTLYRARFSGFSEAEAAQDACRALKRNGFTCFATRS